MAGTKVVTRKRRYQDVVRRVQGLVREGVLKPGDRLPPERELAVRLNVSRSSLREAMRALEFQGLLESRPGAGTYVQSGSLDTLIPVVEDAIQTIAHSTKDIHEIRYLLEPEIAALAAERATKEDIKRMEEAVEDQERQIAAGSTGLEGDTAFHFALAESTQNWGLLIMVSVLADALRQPREKTLEEPGHPQRSLVSHKQLLELVYNGDGPGARSAMQHHLSNVEVLDI